MPTPPATGLQTVGATVTTNRPDHFPENSGDPLVHDTILQEATKLDALRQETQTETSTDPQRERLLKVFEFLKAYTELRFPPVRDVEQQLRFLWLKTLPQHPSVEVFRGNGEADIESEDAGIVLRVTRPNVTACPAPSPAIADWLKAGWQDINGSVDVYASRNVPDEGGQARIERFEEAAQRPALLARWQQERASWQTNERPARQSLALFQTVYEWFGAQEREAERIEILVGDGLLHCADDEGKFRHPVLLQKLGLEFVSDRLSFTWSFSAPCQKRITSRSLAARMS